MHFDLVADFDLVQPDVLQPVQQVYLSGLPNQGEDAVQLQAIA
jgi:hypothetical protein